MDERGRPTIFISYSHENRKQLREVRKFLNARRLELWSDVEIEPGSHWLEEVKKALARCDAALLLLSQDFLNSEFITDTEVRSLLADASTRGVKILWLLLSPCTYNRSELAEYQALHDVKTPLFKLPRTAREQELCKIADKIERVLSAPTPKTAQPVTKPVPNNAQITHERSRQEDFIANYIESRRPKRIDILQFGLVALSSLRFCERAFRCPDGRIRILLVDPNQAARRYSEASRHKEDVLTAVDRIRAEHSKIGRSARPAEPTVGVWYYRTPPSVSAVIVDDELVQLGWYFLHDDFDEPGRLNVSGHDNPGVLVLGDEAKPILPKIRAHFDSVLASVDQSPILLGPRSAELEAEWRDLQRRRRGK